MTDILREKGEEMRRLYAENERLRSAANRGGHMAVAWELQQADEALLRQAADMLATLPVKHPDQIAPRDALAKEIKERLG
jgi:hypothetical protein